MSPYFNSSLKRVLAAKHLPSVFSLAEQNVVDVGQVVNDSRLGCAVRVVLLEPLDSTSSLTVLGDGYVVAGLHTVSIVKDSSRSAEVSAKDVGRRSEKPPISSWHLTATSSPGARRKRWMTRRRCLHSSGTTRDTCFVWTMFGGWVHWADLGRAVVAALVDIGFLADLEVAMGRPNRTATIVVVLGVRD